MEKIKLVSSTGKVINRNKSDYEANVDIWERKGFKVQGAKAESLIVETPKKKKKKKSKK